MRGTRTPAAEVRAILFDWGDTLVHYPGFSNDPQGHAEAVERHFRWMARDAKRECFARSGIALQAYFEAYNAIAASQWTEMGGSNRDQELAFRLREALRRCGCACALADELVARLLESYLVEMMAGCWAIADALEVVSALSRHYPLAVVANYPIADVVHETLERYALKSYFEPIVVSGAVGRMKPDPLPFETAMAALGVVPENVLFVGDDLRNDMQGAKALGCMTAWLPQDQAAPMPADGSVDARLQGLADLFAVLGRDRAAARTMLQNRRLTSS